MISVACIVDAVHEVKLCQVCAQDKMAGCQASLHALTDGSIIHISSHTLRLQKLRNDAVNASDAFMYMSLHKVISRNIILMLFFLFIFLGTWPLLHQKSNGVRHR